MNSPPYAHDLLPTRYRLPLLVLDATGMRVGELEHLTWGDVDEPRGRWRVSQAIAKTGRALWVTVPAELLEAVMRLCPRHDRVPERRVFESVTADSSGRRSHPPVPRLASRRSARTTCVTGGSR